MRVPIGVVKEGERNPEHWILFGGTAENEFIRERPAIDANNNTYNSGDHDNYSGILIKYNKFGELQYSAKTRQPDPTGQESSYGIVADPSNNLYRVSSGYHNPPGQTIAYRYFTKYNSSLQPQFNVKIVTASPLEIFGNLASVHVGSDGNLFATGGVSPNTDVSTDSEAYVAKFNSSGSLQWQRRFGDNRPSYEPSPGAVFYEYYSSRGVATDSDGNVYLLAYGNYNQFLAPDFSSLNPTGAIVVIKYNSSGSFQWKKKFKSSNFQEAVFPSNIFIHEQTSIVNQDGSVSVLPTPIISLYVSASSSGHQLSSTGLLIKLDSSGNIVWQRSVPNQGISSSKLGNDSHIYIVQDYQGGALISKLNLSAEIQWQLLLQAQSCSMGNSGVNVANNGTMYISAYISGNNITQGIDYFQASLPSDGSVYGSYLINSTRVNISKIQDPVALTPSNIVEVPFSTTSAVANNSVSSIGNHVATAVTFSGGKVSI